MPNHVFSEITLHGVSLETASPFLFNAEGKISFRKLLPLPINYWPGSVGAVHEKAFPGIHLDAARETWGTKWDAYGNPDAVEVDGSTVTHIRTAWGTPRGWICALFNTLNCDITVKWLDEGREDGCCEVFKVDGPYGGADWKTEDIPKGAPEHRRLHKWLWGVEEFEDQAND